ncbi:MAG: DUF177 domain-containing protein [Actinobacteria bacterium]|nr:DUF177 domain-containing protein [Actinomycetota bacterium]MCL5445838.1 DUF177 domain-containing protein [Actinomycetota bacterium]
MSNRSHPSRSETLRDGSSDRSATSWGARRSPHASSSLCLPAEAFWRERGVHRQVVIRVGIDGLSCLGSAVPPSNLVDISLGLVAEGVTILVDGVLSAEWEGTCRRCLIEIGGLLTVPVHEMYRQDADDGLVYPITGGIIDLEPLVRDMLLTSLPLAPLCAEGCKGLCPGCGADLNHEDCACGLASARR